LGCHRDDIDDIDHGGVILGSTCAMVEGTEEDHRT
jgi:hypothetical protein